MAVRAALLLLSKRDHPDLVQRLSDYAQDRGAVGLLLSEYEVNQDIEKIALRFWDSRIEKSGSRLEDIVTTALLSTLGSIIAGVIVEMWKGNFGPLERLFGRDEREALRLLARKEPSLRQNLDQVIPFYSAKMEGTGVADQVVADKLSDALRSGLSFQVFAERNPHAISQIKRFDPLAYAAQVSRGVVITELQRGDGGPLPSHHLEREGLPLSPYLAFGETIALFNTDDLGLGPNWPRLLRDKIDAPRLYPELWPAGSGHLKPSPKIFILDERVFSRMRDARVDDLIYELGGIISTDLRAGMTSHLAVMSRSVGIGAIRCVLSEEDCTTAKFGLINADHLKLYRNMPDLQVEELQHFFVRSGKRLLGD